jgi:hypothetical protein
MNMLRIYDINKSEEWDDVVRTFPNYDIYYQSGYVKAFEINGDGHPELLYYEAEDLRAIYVYMKRRIADGMYDAVTPYGYGGVLFDGDITAQNLETFREAFDEQMQASQIVCNFVRFHPVLMNAIPMKAISRVMDLGKTIAMDLSSPEIIWQNIHPKNRNMIRKAEKNGVEIHHGKGMELMDRFMEIYNATMDKDEADAYYFFKRPFYESIDRDLNDNYEMFYAVYEGIIISMSIMIFANGRLNYHLSGSDIEYRNLAPSNLLLYKAALWGCEQGMKTFHLGGGVGSGEDNLYKFKAAFNRISDYQFSIGKQIFDYQKYNRLVELRQFFDPAFTGDSGFFPLYRS